MNLGYLQEEIFKAAFSANTNILKTERPVINTLEIPALYTATL